jgi:uncharacterized protein (DUF1330 family)
VARGGIEPPTQRLLLNLTKLHFLSTSITSEVAMSVKVIGLIKLQDNLAFEEYRAQVSQTIELYQGNIVSRGNISNIFWNELNCKNFDSFVEINFPTQQLANDWANSPEYQKILSVRNKAMNLTLFSTTI